MASKFAVKSRLDHNNRLYEPGAVIELDDEEAQPLIAINVLEPTAEDAKPSKGVKK